MHPYHCNCILEKSICWLLQENKGCCYIISWRKCHHYCTNLKDLLITLFTLDSTKDVQYDDYLNCQQSIIESVDKYSNRFKKFHKKVNPNNRTLVANTICQFLSGLNLTIVPLVYARIPVNLNIIVDIIKSIEAGYKII